MKKAIAILCVLMLAATCCFVLAGCGSKEIPADCPYIGTWKATKATFRGEEVSIGEILGEDGKMIITLRADGTADFSSSDETGAATWWLTGKGLKLKLDDAKSSMKFTAEGDTIFMKMLGASLYFEKTVTVNDVAEDVSDVLSDVGGLVSDTLG